MNTYLVRSHLFNFSLGIAAFSAASGGGATAGETAAAAVAPGAVRWELNNLTSLGGQVPEVLGKPVATRGAGNANAPGGMEFDGAHDGLILPVVPIAGWEQFTVEALIRPDADGQAEQRFLHFEDKDGRRGLMEIRVLPGGMWCLDTFLYSNDGHKLTLIDRSKLHPCGREHWVALTYAKGQMTHFVEAEKECEGEVEIELMKPEGRTSIGVRLNKVYWFKGVIREVRFTPRALAPAELQRVQPQS